MTMNLFKGIAVVIDDEVNTEKTQIANIVSQIEKQNMPLVKYTQLPNEQTVTHLGAISFLILDWNLRGDDILPEGVPVPSTLKASYEEENLIFIEKVRDTCFAPIFIFSKDPSGIEDALVARGLYCPEQPNFIFIKKKSELTGRVALFREITDWIERNPSTYVLMAWQKQYQEIKSKMFHDLYQLSPHWPRIMWKTFEEDGTHMSCELGELITRNLETRMVPFNFSVDILGKRGLKVGKDEIRAVVEGERFLRDSSLDPNSIGVGDVLKISGKMYVNVRPACDCIPDRNDLDASTDDVEVYLLKGVKLSRKKELDGFNKEYGQFRELDCQAIVFSMFEGKSYDFRFKELKIMRWGDIKDKRQGRLLPPYITRIQQRYTQYLQRQAQPRVPQKGIYS